MAEAEARRPFDLARGPAAARRRLLRLAAERARAAADHAPHRLATAGRWACWSRELAALYEAFAPGGQTRLPALPIQYADYAAWQRRWLQGERAADAAGATGSEQLAGAPALLELPTRPAAAGACRPSAARRSRVDAATRELTAGLKALSRREGATLFMTLLAGWSGCCCRGCRGQERRGGGHAERQPRRGGDRGADRVLRQHAGAAGRPVGRPDGCRSCWRG